VLEPVQSNNICDVISSVSFEQLVMKHGNDGNVNGFSSKAPLVATIFSRLARADPLREITNGHLLDMQWNLLDIGLPTQIEEICL